MSHPRLQAVRDEATSCIHCGYCLPVCPTYVAFGQEKHSPRGRIQLAKAWAEGRVELDASLEEAFDLCLGCRACEPACPVGVRYGIILEGARDELARRRASQPAAWLVKLLLRYVVAHPRRLRFFVRLIHRVFSSRLGEWLHSLAARRPGSWLAGALTFVRALPAPRIPPPPTAELENTVAATTKSAISAARLGQPPTTERRTVASTRSRRAAVFLGCAQEGLFPETNRSTIALLELAGYEVVIPRGQVCCGALHRHNGDATYARVLVLRNLRAFGAYDEVPPYDVIALNAGGCLAWLKEAAELFPPETLARKGAQRLAERARDLSQILVEAGFEIKQAADCGERLRESSSTPVRSTKPGHDNPKPVNSRARKRIVYQPSCHLSHVCRVVEEPVKLLRGVASVEVTLPSDRASCCGSAGIYSALHPQASLAILERKMASITAVAPDVIVTCNPGCHLQLIAGVRAKGLQHRVQVLQLPDFLASHLSAYEVTPNRAGMHEGGVPSTGS